MALLAYLLIYADMAMVKSRFVEATRVARKGKAAAGATGLPTKRAR